MHMKAICKMRKLSNGGSNTYNLSCIQRTLTVGGRITVQLVSSLTRLELTNKDKYPCCYCYAVKHSNPNLQNMLNW